VSITITIKYQHSLKMALKTFTTADGSANQALVTNGSGVLSFATPAAGSLVLLGSTDGNNVASLSLNGFFTSDYDVYEIYILGIVGYSNDQPLYVRFATGGGYTEQSSNYFFSTAYAVNSSVTNEWGSSASQIRLNQQTSSTSASASNFKITLYNPNRGDQYKGLTCNYHCSSSDLSSFSSSSGGGQWKDTTAITGIKFFLASGNMIATKIRIYGVKNT